MSKQAVELTVVVKDAERTQKQKFLIYEKIALDVHDLVVKWCLDEAIKNFNSEPEDVVIKATMVCR